MRAEQLIINYIPVTDSGRPGVWLALEQQPTPLSERNATLADMVQMFNRVVAGESARSYQLEKCKSATVKTDGTIVVTLQVYVWPSSMGLPYTFTPSYGSVSLVEVVSLEREIDLVVDGSSSVSLPWLMDTPTAWWQMDCVNEFCEVVPNPTISVAGAAVSLSSSCYGVLRVRGQASGYKHTLTMDFAKQGNVVADKLADATWVGPTPTAAPSLSGYAITDIDISVTATYTDGAGEEQSEILALNIPDCVKDLLEYCEDGRLIHGTESVTVGDTETPVPVVYYATCTGNVIALRYE